ncbi:DUF6101 family protein [Acuticoccus sp. MNP-M23]|uniref:DUF6101 family protein n=1 Tax=Acuticoccus sp. MNP-M23 TaxID=3072793 RepID=UPI002815CF93|nr:DUF6101 family protein [Acuticoccus sp. MNP-M23]WMS44734.1 DUF6101 family protein [Acuticoccus sp. MNP-M23]
MNAVSNAAIAMPHNATHPVMTSPAALFLPANDAIPRRQTAAPVAAPRRREIDVDVPATQEPVTIASPDAAAATMPLDTYRGIAVTVERCDGEPMFQLTLQHSDDAHSVPLACGMDVAVIAREWQAWAKALSLPLIAIDADGSVHAELNALGVLLAENPSPRRRGSPLVGRRSRFGRARRAAPLPFAMANAPRIEEHREIIART